MPSNPSKTDREIAAEPHPVGIRGYRIRNTVRAEQRRHEILIGAARAFAHRGYDATNMDQIAHECGLAKGHIYHYFHSKEEIFTEIRIEAVNRALQRLAPIVPLAREDPAAALRQAISSVVSRICNADELYEPAVPDPATLSVESHDRIRVLGRRYEQIFSDIVRTGIQKRVFVRGDPKLMTFVILRAAFTVPQWYRPGGRWAPQFIVKQVAEQLLRSVMVKRPSPAR